MKEELVSFSTAKLAKEKGFNWKVLDTFASDGMPVSRYAVNEDGLESYITTGDEDYLEEVMELSNSEMQSDFVARPTQSLLQKWFRDEKKIIIIVYNNPLGFSWEINKFNGALIEGTDDSFPYYEESLEDCLHHSLKKL